MLFQHRDFLAQNGEIFTAGIVKIVTGLEFPTVAQKHKMRIDFALFVILAKSVYRVQKFIVAQCQKVRQIEDDIVPERNSVTPL